MQTILTSATAHTMGRQLSGLVQSPFFVEGEDKVCPVCRQGGLPSDDVTQAVGEDAEAVGGELVVRLRWEAVVARGFVFPETLHGLSGLHGW